MIKHIVTWNFIESVDEVKRQALALSQKEELEKLKDVISGIVELEAIIVKEKSSNVDFALISTFESVEALEAYQVHPAHQRCATLSQQFLKDRKCLDYQI